LPQGFTVQVCCDVFIQQVSFSAARPGRAGKPARLAATAHWRRRARVDIRTKEDDAPTLADQWSRLALLPCLRARQCQLSARWLHSFTLWAPKGFGYPRAFSIQGHPWGSPPEERAP
jgi:hypothetical protein